MASGKWKSLRPPTQDSTAQPIIAVRVFQGPLFWLWTVPKGKYLLDLKRWPATRWTLGRKKVNTKQHLVQETNW